MVGVDAFLYLGSSTEIPAETAEESVEFAHCEYGDGDLCCCLMKNFRDLCGRFKWENLQRANVEEDSV